MATLRLGCLLILFLPVAKMLSYYLPGPIWAVLSVVTVIIVAVAFISTVGSNPIGAFVLLIFGGLYVSTDMCDPIPGNNGSTTANSNAEVPTATMEVFVTPPLSPTSTPAFTSSPTVVPTPTTSLDGKIVFVSEREDGRNHSCVLDLKEKYVNKLLYVDSGGSMFPKWSPDGTKIVLGCASTPGICVIDADGSNVAL